MCMWKYVKHEINKIPCTTCFISTALIDSIEICKQRSVIKYNCHAQPLLRQDVVVPGQDSEHHQQQKHSEPRLQDVGKCRTSSENGMKMSQLLVFHSPLIRWWISPITQQWISQAHHRKLVRCLQPVVLEFGKAPGGPNRIPTKT